jgi:hypothetical protein
MLVTRHWPEQRHRKPEHLDKLGCSDPFKE